MTYRHFARHYAEMVLVMFLGMAVLGPLAGLALGLLRWRGHGWRPTNEMSASMIVPTLAVIGLDFAGAMNDVGTMLLVEHVAMLLGMFAVMALRPSEYSMHHHAVAVA